MSKITNMLIIDLSQNSDHEKTTWHLQKAKKMSVIKIAEKAVKQ